MTSPSDHPPPAGEATPPPPSASRTWPSGRGVEVIAGALAAAAALVGAVQRFTFRGPLWLDEAQSVAIARVPLGSLVDTLRLDGAPPLYYLALRGWMALFGDGDAALRSLSGLLSLAGIGAAAALGHRLGGRRAAVFAAVLVAVNPLVVRYGSETRMYSLVMLEATVLALGLATCLTADRRRAGWLVVVAGAAAALPWTHYWGLYLLVAVAMGVVAMAWRCPTRRTRAVEVGVAVAVGGATWAAWLPVFLHQSAHTASPWAEPARIGDLEGSLIRVAGGSADGTMVLFAALVVLFVVGVAGTARASTVVLHLRGTSPGRELGALGLATLLVALAAGRLSGSAFQARYATVAVVLLLVVVALGLTRLPRPVAAAGLALVAGLSLFEAQYVNGPRTQAGRIADALAAGLAPGDVVAFCPDQLGPAVARLVPALDGGGRGTGGVPVATFTYPTGSGAALVDWTDYRDAAEALTPSAFAAQVRQAAQAAGGRTWLVSSGRYFGLEEACDEVHELLTGAVPRVGPLPPGVHQVVDPDGRFFENATLSMVEPGALAPAGAGAGR